jgi:hypothetical protein
MLEQPLSPPVSAQGPNAALVAPRSVADLLQLPDEHRHLVNWLLKHGEATAEDVVGRTGQPEADCLALLDQLIEKGFVQRHDTAAGPRYRVHLGSRRRAAPSQVWQRLG